MSRTAILLSASFILAIAGCGDDTGGEGGSTSSSTSASGSTSSTPSTPASSGSSSDGGSTNEGGSTSDGGAPGDGGAGGAGDGGFDGGLGGGSTLVERCEALNDKFVAFGEDLECPPEFLGDCSEPIDCPEEAEAYIRCVYDAVESADDCICADGGAHLFCPAPDCDDEFDDYDTCLAQE